MVKTGEKEKKTAAAAQKHAHHWRRAWTALAVIAAILIALRLYLPVWLLHYVNRKINETPNYSGEIEAVDLHLWRGAYAIRNIAIFRSNGKVPVPFFSAPSIALSVQWKALLHGAFVGDMEFYRPQMHFVKGPTEAETQVGVDQPWIVQIKKLFPLKINHFHVENGEIWYHDFSSNPQINLKLSQVYMTATNLTNSDKLSKTEVASLQAEGRPVEEGTNKADVNFDPFQNEPTFDLKAEAAGVPLMKLSPLTEAYAYFSFKGGTFDGAAELHAAGGKFAGWIKPVFDHMQIFSLQQDIKNPVKLLWEGLLGSIGRLLRNQPKDRFATEVPLSGSFESPKGAVLPAIGNIFKNAFIQVFSAKVPGGVNLDEVHEKEAPSH